MIDYTVLKDKKALYYTLGCKLNFSETSTIERQLQEAGIRTAKRGEKADICIINSCAVTQEAEKKCRQVIHKLVRQNPGAYVVVTGCYAQLSAEKLSKEIGVDVVLGVAKKGEVLEHLGNLVKHETSCIHVLAVTVHVISSRCRMAVIISVLTAPSPLHVAAAAIRS